MVTKVNMNRLINGSAPLKIQLEKYDSTIGRKIGAHSCGGVINRKRPIAISYGSEPNIFLKGG